jgi:hypothetical protein
MTPEVVGTVAGMARFVFDPSWLGDVPPPRRPLLLFDGG